MIQSQIESRFISARMVSIPQTAAEWPILVPPLVSIVH